MITSSGNRKAANTFAIHGILLILSTQNVARLKGIRDMPGIGCIHLQLLIVALKGSLILKLDTHKHSQFQSISCIPANQDDRKSNLGRLHHSSGLTTTLSLCRDLLARVSSFCAFGVFSSVGGREGNCVRCICTQCRMCDGHNI